MGEDTWYSWGYDSTSTTTSTTITALEDYNTTNVSIWSNASTWEQWSHDLHWKMLRYSLNTDQEKTWHWWQNASRTPAIHIAPSRVDWRVAEEARRQEREKLKLEEAAKKRARELLRSFLDRDQLEQLEKTGKFDVRGGDGKLYRINPDRQHHNIARLGPNGKPVEELCIYVKGRVPLGDNALAQKLMLESEIGKVNRIANRMSLVPANGRN